jgi:hypothetical protein
MRPSAQFSIEGGQYESVSTYNEKQINTEVLQFMYNDKQAGIWTREQKIRYKSTSKPLKTSLYLGLTLLMASVNG